MNKHLIEQYKQLYNQKPTYGASSKKIFDIILPIVEKYAPSSILDYGCGKSPLVDMINEKTGIKIYKFDPVFEEYNNLPQKNVDFVICTDVLQHIPVNELFENLKEISNCGNICFYKIKCTDHPTKFPNGEPTNITIFDKNKWKKILLNFYNDIKEIEYFDETSVIYLAIKKDNFC